MSDNKKKTRRQQESMDYGGEGQVAPTLSAAKRLIFILFPIIASVGAVLYLNQWWIPKGDGWDSIFLVGIPVTGLMQIIFVSEIK